MLIGLILIRLVKSRRRREAWTARMSSRFIDMLMRDFATPRTSRWRGAWASRISTLPSHRNTQGVVVHFLDAQHRPNSGHWEPRTQLSALRLSAPRRGPPHNNALGEGTTQASPQYKALGGGPTPMDYPRASPLLGKCEGTHIR